MRTAISEERRRRVLEALRETGGLTAPKLALRLQWTRSAAYLCLETLRSAGHVTRQAESASWHVADRRTTHTVYVYRAVEGITA